MRFERSSGTLLRPALVLLLSLLLGGCLETPLEPSSRDPNDPGDGGVITDPPPDGVGLIGNSLPADWRPYSSLSPWNRPIPDDVRVRAESDLVISFMETQASHIRLARSYTIPVWVVNSDEMPTQIIRSDKIYDTWDRDRDGWSDVGVPLIRGMWGENTGDGHICIIDPYKGTAWEMSRFSWADGAEPQCTTFNIWDLTGRGYADANAGGRWQLLGGRGSGFSIIAGLIRPEEMEAGEIRHALVFTFGSNRKAENGNMFMAPPAARSDGKFIGEQYPIEGARFQLDPTLTDRDFDAWGLEPSARVVARALQTYGMYLGDNGGDMALQVQLLSPNESEHRRIWDERVPGFYRAVDRIPTSAFRLVESGEVVIK